MPLVDYHLHTPLCGHATGEPAEYVAVARARGLDEIGFSDHCPMPDLAGGAPFDDWRMRPSELPRYFEMIAQARANAAPFPVRLGLECDFIAGREPWIEELAGTADWDYLIGSVHYLAPGWDVDNPRHLSRFTASPGAVEEIWTLYWRAFADCARSGLFDFLAHPDLVKKFGHRPAGDLRRFYEPAIAAVAASGVALELSTAGLHKPVGELYPSADFLALTHAAGVPIVINSDAHAPEEVGRDFDRAIAAARAAGYRASARFERRARRLVALPD
ncbi:MAG: histidinol-phosphatase [Verrucomicrobia bacterium]|nr:histidinol-phosphatase [Verrucomicrobiota bacterium]